MLLEIISSISFLNKTLITSILGKSYLHSVISLKTTLGSGDGKLLPIPPGEATPGY